MNAVNEKNLREGLSQKMRTPSLLPRPQIPSQDPPIVPSYTLCVTVTDNKSDHRSTNRSKDLPPPVAHPSPGPFRSRCDSFLLFFLLPSTHASFCTVTSLSTTPRPLLSAGSDWMQSHRPPSNPISPFAELMLPRVESELR